MSAYAHATNERHMGKFAGSKSKVSAFGRAAAKAEPTEPKGDEFDVGKFRVGFADCSVAESGSFCLKFEGRGKDEKIGERIQWLSTAGKAARVSAPRAKAMCMALTGLDVDAYNEFDPNGEFVDTIFPYDVDAAAAYLVQAGAAKNAKAAQKAIEEAEFYIRITKGGDKDDGGFFRNCAFEPIDEDTDDSEDEDDTDEEPESEPAPKRGKASKRAPVEEDEDEDEDEDDTDTDEEPESEPEPRRAKKKAARR